MSIVFHELPSLQAAAAAISEAMGNGLRVAIRSRGKATFAVSGGNTPRHIFPLMAKCDLNWNNVHVTLVDERWVPADHPESNERLARELLLKEKAAHARFSGLVTAAATPHSGLEEVENRLGALSWPLDIVFLGMGEDGHIASLFPGETHDGEKNEKCIAVAATSDRYARMSLSPHALLNSRHIFLVLSGSAKRSTYEAALRKGPFRECPLRIVLHQDKVPVSVYAFD